MLDFLCIGAQKAGTSWLYQQLLAHPAVAFPQGKEVHYWDWVQMGKRPDDLSWYQRKFCDQPGKKLGDITPGYATLQSRWIQQIASAFPAVRVIFILRNPIERAWSAARMALEFAQLTPEEAGDDWFRTHMFSAASRARGDYETTIRKWRAKFPASQLHILCYDELVAEPRAFLTKVAHAIDIDSQPLVEKSSIRIKRRYNAGVEVPISAPLREELRAYYAPRIESLAAYLNVNCGHWLKSA